MTSIEFAATVTAAIAGSEEAVEALIRIAVGSGFMARKARCELRKLGVEVRRCEGCRWQWNYRNRSACRSPESIFFYAQHARESKNDCGPAGRYWEPREDAK